METFFVNFGEVVHSQIETAIQALACRCIVMSSTIKRNDTVTKIINTIASFKEIISSDKEIPPQTGARMNSLNTKIRYILYRNIYSSEEGSHLYILLFQTIQYEGNIRFVKT